MKIKLFSIGLVTVVLSQGAFAAAQIVYFGPNEVQSGQLKSADGTLPQRGELVDLRVDLLGISKAACGNNSISCVGMSPQLYVRFSDQDQFHAIGPLPVGGINPRGPAVDLGNYDAFLGIPANADRIEAYMKWQLHSWSASNCHLAYDQNECDVWVSPKSYEEVFISNYGRNFSIGVK